MLRFLPGIAGGLALFLVASAAAPGVARAYEEQVTLGFALGYAYLPLAPDEAPAHGLGGGVNATYGLGDTWSLEGRLEHAWLPDEIAPTHLTRLSAGAIYALDVLTLVPFFGFGLGGAVASGRGEVRGDFLVYASVGLDYLLSRRFLVGLDARVDALPIRNAEAVDLLVVSAGLRFSLVFDTY